MAARSVWSSFSCPKGTNFRTSRRFSITALLMTAVPWYRSPPILPRDSQAAIQRIRCFASGYISGALWMASEQNRNLGKRNRLAPALLCSTFVRFINLKYGARKKTALDPDTQVAGDGAKRVQVDQLTSIDVQRDQPVAEQTEKAYQ